MIGARSATIAAFTAITIASIAIIALWVFPGYLSTSSNCAIRESIGGSVYCAESVQVHLPCGGGVYCPFQQSQVFHGAAFEMSLSNGSEGPGIVGWASVANTTYRFAMWANPLGPTSLNWTSPNQLVAVEWQAPFVTVSNDGVVSATVIFGVSLGLASGS
jgi:hypothetical protein